VKWGKSWGLIWYMDQSFAVRKDRGLNRFCVGDVLSRECSHKQVLGSFSGDKSARARR